MANLGYEKFNWCPVTPIWQMIHAKQSGIRVIRPAFGGAGT